MNFIRLLDKVKAPFWLIRSWWNLLLTDALTRATANRVETPVYTTVVVRDGTSTAIYACVSGICNRETYYSFNRRNRSIDTR